MTFEPERVAPSGWPAAVRLLARWLERRERIDTLLETLPSSLTGAERARCHNLVLGVVRHFGRIESALTRLVSHAPRFLTRAILCVAGYELIESLGSAESEGRTAKIVHHAVEQTKSIASPAESRLVNAVVRKLAAELRRAPPAADAAPDVPVWAEYYSHPAWLISAWLAQFGPGPTRALLEWNQQPPPVYARWRTPVEAGGPPEFLSPTRWPGFFEVAPGHWPQVEPLLKSGRIYLQDPSTRIPVELLAPRAGEQILDLCAAPGGKALLIADAMGKGRLVAVDLPGPRIERLKENLSRAGETDVALVQADVRENLASALHEHRLPAEYAAVLLDVPCSNTGVMRHRVDVKWRLQPGDFKKHPQQQLGLLHDAARFVAPGGRLVYSTCSLDAEENEEVIREFFASRAGSGFQRGKEVISRPWVDGHDGGAAFVLQKHG